MPAAKGMNHVHTNKTCNGHAVLSSSVPTIQVDEKTTFVFIYSKVREDIWTSAAHLKPKLGVYFLFVLKLPLRHRSFHTPPIRQASGFVEPGCHADVLLIYLREDKMFILQGVLSHYQGVKRKLFILSSYRT